MVTLDVGESVSASICARVPWNHTGIMLVANQEYCFKATGEWRDFYGRIPCDADGFNSSEVGRHYLWLFEWLRRAPSHKWFALIGSIGRSKKPYFKIGTKHTLRLRHTGELVCFANDVPGFYRNNSGSIGLEVTRIA